MLSNAGRILRTLSKCSWRWSSLPHDCSGTRYSSADVAAPGSKPFRRGPKRVAPLFQSGGAPVVQQGVVYVHNSMNNTILTLTGVDGRVAAVSSCGTVGFKNSNKSTPLATEKAADDLARKALKLGFASVIVKLKGMGRNKQFAVQSLSKSGLRITQLQDITPIAYNGCRLPRKRRT